MNLLRYPKTKSRVLLLLLISYFPNFTWSLWKTLWLKFKISLWRNFVGILSMDSSLWLHSLLKISGNLEMIYSTYYFHVLDKWSYVFNSLFKSLFKFQNYWFGRVLKCISIMLDPSPKLFDCIWWIFDNVLEIWEYKGFMVWKCFWSSCIWMNE